MAAKPKEPSLLQEVGSTGLKRSGGWINEEWLRELRGRRRWEIYREMRDNDPGIGALLFAIEMLLRRVEWTVDAAGPEPAAEQAALFLEEVIADMSTSWEATVSEVLSFLPYGFDLQEIVYKRRSGPGDEPSTRSKYTDGRLGWRKLTTRAQETVQRWIFDEGGGIQGIVQAVSGRPSVEIPIDRLLLFRTSAARNNPEGRSILRNAYRPWYFKKRVEETEGIGIERDLAGLPVAHCPAAIMASSASAEQRAVFDALKDIVRNIRRDEQEGVVLPQAFDSDGNPLYKLELLSTGGSRQFDTDKIIGRYDSRILMTVLADFILLGHEKVGSFALSSDKTDLFAVALSAWLSEIRSVMNTHAIPRLWRLNGMPEETVPTLTHGDIESPDLEALSNFVQRLSAAGLITLDGPLEDYLRRAANLPKKEEGPA